YPSSRRPWWNASIRADNAAGDAPPRNPIRGIFFGCCAWAGTQSAKNRELNARPKNFLLIVLSLFVPVSALLSSLPFSFSLFPVRSLLLALSHPPFCYL